MSQERAYVLTNAREANAVAVFDRAQDGSLVPLGRPEPLAGLPSTFAPASGYRPASTFATGGRGTNGVVPSQGALVCDSQGRYLFAVNPGSDDISVFAITATGIRLLGRTPSLGVEPRSLTIHADLLYVLNGFGDASFAGFRIGANGGLTHLPGSARSLDSSNSGPVQISFDQTGRHLVITELFADRISVVAVGASGRPEALVANQSAGLSPFGFTFNRTGHLIVSESFAFRPGQSAVSSYRLDDDGKLHVISASVPTFQSAACWIASTPDGQFAYASNTASGSVSGFRVSTAGKLIPLSDDGRTGVTGATSAPIDMVTSRDGGHLYVLNQARLGIASFRIEADGQLTPEPGTGGLGPFALGLSLG